MSLIDSIISFFQSIFEKFGKNDYILQGRKGGVGKVPARREEKMKFVDPLILLAIVPALIVGITIHVAVS